MIEITEAMMTDILGYMAEIFTDLSPIILLIVGVGVVLILIGGIIRAIRG